MGQICFEFRIFLDASKVTDYCITWHLKWYMKFWPKIIDCQIFLQQRLVYSGSKGCNSRSVIMVSLLQVLTGKRNAFIEKMELERVILNKKYSAFLWLSLCQEKNDSLLYGLCYCCRVWELPLLVFQVYLTEVFTVLIFLQRQHEYQILIFLPWNMNIDTKWDN